MLSSIRNITVATSLIFSSLFCMMTSAHADGPALDFDLATDGGSNYYQGSYSLGWRFSATQNVSVNALGYYDAAKNGLVQSHAVGIYDFTTCQLLASTTVTNSDALTGTFRYHPITPIVLNSGQSYYIAGLTGSSSQDPYAISVTTIHVDPAISYWGYAIYGNTQGTSTLQCPNGSAGQFGFHGDYGPSFLIGTQDNSGGPSTPILTPTPSAINKRPTAINLFCNRTGVNLETADCSVVVADAGAPPRSAPTGPVNFTTSNGFFPANGSCLLQQTPYSTGIVSCKAQFAIPFGFAIGIAFPIDATYLGDSKFAGSSTSHTTIQAGCVGDATNPCSGAVALGFADFPQILKNALATVFECGSVKKTRGVGGALSKCLGTIKIDSKVAEILSQMDLSQLQALGNAISIRDAKTDLLLESLKVMTDPKNQLELQKALADQQKLNDLLLKIIQQRSDKQKNLINNLRSLHSRAKLKINKTVTLGCGTSSISVNNNNIKSIKVKFNKTAVKFFKAVKAAGKSDANLNISIKGNRSIAPKKPFNSSITVNAGIGL